MFDSRHFRQARSHYVSYLKYGKFYLLSRVPTSTTLRVWARTSSLSTQ